MNAPSLFPDLVPVIGPSTGATPEPVEKLSADRRRTLRQRADIGRGRHPLTGSRLHPDEDARCGNCRFRAVVPWHSRSYPKCFYEPAGWDVERMKGWPRVTHSAASDVRAWWPGCTDHEWGDPKLSPDAARCRP
jgi:hypothetical protein